MYQKGWMYNMILPWLTGGIAALDLFIKDEIEREGEEEFPRDLPGTAAAGALGAFMTKKCCLAQKIGLSMVLGGAISNLYDRLVKGYVVDYFSIEFKRLKKVIFNLGDIFVFLGSLVFLIGELLEDIDLKN